MSKTAVLPQIAKELSGLDHVPVSSLEPFQGALKDLSEREYNKLKKSMLEEGIFVPFFVWNQNGRTRILDGHQRDTVMITEHWEMDVPVIWIFARDEEHAKKRLLLISSQYGHITQEGWDSFTFNLPDDWLQETVQFDALPWIFDEVPNFAPVPADEQPRLDEKNPVYCPHCGLNIHAEAS